MIAVGHIVDHITIVPATATITTGETETYAVEAFFDWGDHENTSLGDVTADVTFEIDPGAGGSWDENEYTSENAGQWTVTATYEGKSDTATLIVTSE